MVRIIHDRSVTAARGLATDEVLMGSPALHLYTYERAALVGRYQDLDANIDTEWCTRAGVEYNRRLTGGGAIVMTPDQLGIALTLDRETHDLPRNITAVFEHFGSGIVRALNRLGIDARFVPKNDIVADGRKIAGLGLWERTSEVQFHCSLLVDIDYTLLSNALAFTDAKLSDKAADSAADRITTVSEQAGVGVEAAADAVAAGFNDILDLTLTEDQLTADERERIDRLVEKRYSTDDWRYLVDAETDTGTATTKTDGGLLRVYARIEDETLAAIQLTGDFFASQATVTAIESALKWTPLERDALIEALEAAPTITGVTAEDIVAVTLEAARSAPDQA